MPKIRSNHTGSATQPRDAIRSSSASIVRYRAAEPPPARRTEPDERRYCGIPYVDCYFYFDTVKYLTKSEIVEADQGPLRARCKHLDIREHGEWIYPKNGTPYQLNIWPYRFRVEIHVPDHIALAYLAELPQTIVTAAHIARDFTFDDERDKYSMLHTFEECWVQRWQRKRRRISFDNGGISTGRRPKGSYFTLYASKPCRIDGIWDCLHGEGRHHGRKALERIGIFSSADLLDFNFQAYWREKDRQSLKRINRAQLGRQIRNQLRGQRDQKVRSRDRRIGGLIWRLHGTDNFGIISSEQFIRSYPRCRSAKNIIGTVDTERRQP